MRARLAQILLHAIGDKESLILAIRRLIVADQRATLAGRPEVFPLALRVVRYHCACAFQNHLRGAIVLFEPNRPASGEVLFELENVLDVRAAPTIDRLILVADHANISIGTCQQFHQFVLWTVRILVLIDQNIFVTAVVLFSGFARRLEQPHCFKQEIVEVERVGLE